MSACASRWRSGWARRGSRAFPDRDVGFQAVDGFGEQLERRAAVRGEDADEEGSFADRYPAEPMNEKHAGARVVRREFGEVFLEELAGHRFVCFVVQTSEGDAAFEFAHDALKFNGSADFAIQQLGGRGDDGGVGENDFEVHGAGG